MRKLCMLKITYHKCFYYVITLFEHICYNEVEFNMKTDTLQLSKTSIRIYILLVHSSEKGFAQSSLQNKIK